MAGRSALHSPPVRPDRFSTQHPAWDAPTFSTNRDRLHARDIAPVFRDAVAAQTRAEVLIVGPAPLGGWSIGCSLSVSPEWPFRGGARARPKATLDKTSAECLLCVPGFLTRSEGGKEMADDAAQLRAETMTDGPDRSLVDVPHDPDLPLMAGKRIPDGGGMFSRELKAIAATRRHRAKWMRDSGDADAAACEEHDAAYLDRHADRFRDPLQVLGGPLAAGNGGEMVAEYACSDPFQRKVRQPPDMLAAEATEHRLSLTAGISSAALTLALDASESIGASDALERNLAHQMAAAHTVGMAMLAKAHSFTVTAATWAPEGRQQMQSIEAARMATAAARLLDASQRAALTLERLRNGGRQLVTVQHVTVREGGRAVVAGTVKRGDGR